MTSSHYITVSKEGDIYTCVTSIFLPSTFRFLKHTFTWSSIPRVICSWWQELKPTLCFCLCWTAHICSKAQPFNTFSTLLTRRQTSFLLQQNKITAKEPQHILTKFKSCVDYANKKSTSGLADLLCRTLTTDT